MKKLLLLIRLFIGFFMIGLGVYLMRIANLGLNPWSTFHTGLSIQTGLKFGTISQLTGLSLIIISLFMKIYPGVATILNMFFCGFFINLLETTNFIPHPNGFFIKCIYFFLGLWTLSFGICSYLSCKLGAGPRDGLMIGIVKKTKFKVTSVRTTIEVSVFLLGVLLGGPVGIGTVFAAFSSGYILHLVFNLMNYDTKHTHHLTLREFKNEMTR